MKEDVNHELQSVKQQIQDILNILTTSTTCTCTLSSGSGHSNEQQKTSSNKSSASSSSSSILARNEKAAIVDLNMDNHHINAHPNTSAYTYTSTSLYDSSDVRHVDSIINTNANMNTNMSEGIAYNASNSNDREYTCSGWNDMLIDIIISVGQFLDVPSIACSMRHLNKHWNDISYNPDAWKYS